MPDNDECLDQCECQCGCKEAATGTDIPSGVRLCEQCADYCVTGGDVICSRMTEDWTRCHVCKQAISWSDIEALGGGRSNSCAGTCACGEAWRAEDHGGHWQYSYAV